MISTLRKIIVIDLEATCYEGEFPKEERPEIIQIGACLLDLDKKEITKKDSYIIHPYHSSISKYCETLTGITPERAKRGIRFDHARNRLAKNFGTKRKIWGAWGEGDRIEFEQECQNWNVEYPFSNQFINISTLFSLYYGFNKKINLEKALTLLGLNFQGRPHDAEDDAYNTALILLKILGEGRG